MELKVEYMQGDLLVNRTMNQVELAAMLLDEGVVLLSVNKDPAIINIRKPKRKGCSHASAKCK